MSTIDPQITLDELLTVVRGAKERPSVSSLYTKLADLNAKPVDLSPLKAVAAANQSQGQRDFLGGLALSALGGRTVSQHGRELSREGLTRSRPLRPNAADVGYENVETGEMVVNPLLQHNQDIRSTETALRSVEAAEGRELAVANAMLGRLEAAGRDREAMALRRTIANMNYNLGLMRIGDARDRAAAAAANRGGRGNEPPSAIQTRLLENRGNLDFITTAISEGDKYPDAFGVKTFIPAEVLSRLDDKGVTARAFVQNIGSLKIHDRSGAAVTAAEFPRLKRFIPIDGDDWKTVRRKLQGFQTELGLMDQAIKAGWPNSALVANLDKKPGARAPVTDAATSAPTPAPAPAPGTPSTQDLIQAAREEMARRNRGGQ